MILLPLEKELQGSEKYDPKGKLPPHVHWSIPSSSRPRSGRLERWTSQTNSSLAPPQFPPWLLTQTQNLEHQMDYCLPRLGLTTQGANTFPECYSTLKLCALKF